MPGIPGGKCTLGILAPLEDVLDVIMGAIELGIPYLSAYAFSTENWRRSPERSIPHGL